MPKNKTTNCIQIDIRKMKRSGMLELLDYDGTFDWHLPGFGLNVTVTLVDQGITVGHRDNQDCWIEYLVPVLSTNCYIKGSRPWFGCPVCGRRVAILYSKGTGKFACRKCQHLAYQSQSEGVGDRAHRSANNIRRRLGWNVGTAYPEGDRPKGMHWKTFDKLRTRYAISAQVTFMDTARFLARIMPG